MGSHRKNSTRQDQPADAGGDPPDPPPNVEPSAAPPSHHDRETLPPLDTIRPEHVAYVRALVAKFAITPTHEREDLAQEILIQAHRSKHSQLEPRALLFGITRHVVYRWIATHQHEQAALAAQQLQSPEEDPHPSAEEEWQASERREVVRASISELPDMFKDVFVRVEVEEMSMPEAAKDLGIPVNTGYTRLHLARARFTELFRRLLARRRIGKEDLALPVLLADRSAGRLVERGRPPSRSGPFPAGPSVARAARPPASPVGCHRGAAPRGRVHREPRRDAAGAPRADVVAEPAAPARSTAPFQAARSRYPTDRSCPPVRSRPPAPRPTWLPRSRVTPRRSRRPRPRPSPPRAHTGAAPCVAPARPRQATIRTDGAWARDIAKLALAGDRAAAAAELAAFRKAYPNSTYITRLEAMVINPPTRPPPSAPTSEAPPPTSSP